jgi:hypothetical protein
MQESFNRLLEQYEFLSAQIDKQTQLLRKLAETARYRERVKILQSIPMVGLISATELLLELQDVSRPLLPNTDSPNFFDKWPVRDILPGRRFQNQFLTAVAKTAA